MFKVIRDPRNPLINKLGVVKRDIKSKETIGLFTKLQMWSQGFRSDKYYLYDLENNDYNDYLSDHQHLMTSIINGPFLPIFANKIIFEEVISKYMRVPKNYGFIGKGKIFPLHSNSDIRNIESMLEFCDEQKGIVIKPVGGTGGKGVTIVRIIDKKILINYKETSKVELKAYIESLDNFIITEFIEQDEYADKLYPHSTNTIRILMMVDPDTHKPFIAGAAQRIGGTNTGGLDNFSQGGYSSNINLDTGELSAAACNSGEKGLIWYKQHPDTGSLIKGTKIPRWDEVKDILITAMQNLPYIQYVGWDVVITKDDIVIIEGNNNPVVRIIQLHRPLLKEQRIKEFYEHHGVV